VGAARIVAFDFGPRRLRTVRRDHRLVAVGAEDRVRDVAAEQAVLLVSAESRSRSIGAEYRTSHVTGGE
jgi:hypothetical protein